MPACSSIPAASACRAAKATRAGAFSCRKTFTICHPATAMCGWPVSATRSRLTSRLTGTWNNSRGGRDAIPIIAGDVMDDMTKKIFVRLDASMPGERVNAVDLFYDHLQKIGQTCRDIIYEFEQAIPAQKYADLEKLYNTAAQENAQ